MKIWVAKWWRYHGVAEHEATPLKDGHVVVERDYLPPEVLSPREWADSRDKALEMARKEGCMLRETLDLEYRNDRSLLQYCLARLEESEE